MSDFYFPAFDEFDLSVEESSLCEYFMRLRGMSDRAVSDFEYVLSSWGEVETLRTAIDHEVDAMIQQGVKEGFQIDGESEVTRSYEVNLIYTPGLSMAEFREQSTLLRAECVAGSLILMIDDAVQRLRHAIWNDASQIPMASQFELGKMHRNRGHAATAGWAAGNAYRHVKDWEGLINAEGIVEQSHSHYRRSRSTLAVLDTTIGLDSFFRGSICIETLFALANADEGPSFDALWNGSLTNIGTEFAERYCADPDAYHKVGEALQYLDNYHSTGVSFSMNPALFEGNCD